jgi:hypothetical protein
LIFDVDIPREVQASRPLQKGKGRAATPLAVAPRNSKSNSKSKSTRAVVVCVFSFRR